ncbi:MAG: protein-glutamate O-methyltransferase CheR [Prochloraceae cyanobacterium]|nr:protein-glutamate O-methyltransferase CheR [Prochloraceae cyanobacterium]
MSINDADFRYIRQLVKNRTSVTLAEDKAYLVESRLAALAKKTGASSVSYLLRKLRSQPFNRLHLEAIESMMITESCFFRDRHPFTTLQNFIIPELINKRQTQKRLNIWCAGCSSGQEPYSIAILLREYFPQLTSWQVSLIASDVSQTILERARQGCYNHYEITRGLSPDLRAKYLQRRDKYWQIQTEIRQMVEFIQFNLTDKWPPMSSLDIIFLRNVLIYFEVDTKKVILAKVREWLKPDGYLFLGAGETTIEIDRAFKPVQFNKTTCYQLIYS